MKKYFGLALIIFFTLTTTTSAHVVIRPDYVGTGSFQTFNIGVPTEEDTETTMIRLIIPDGLSYVTPTVKPGWTIETKMEGDVVKEITWRGGSIPAHQRDDFTFNAKTPDHATTLLWKAYQSHKNGPTIAWDLAPSAPQPQNFDGSPDFSTQGPLSQTIVSSPNRTSSLLNEPFIPLGLGIIALLFSIVALLNSGKKRK